jgi:hypothetical protein
MSIDRLLTIIGLVAAIAAVYVALEWWPLILVSVGLISGFLSPLEDMASRTAYAVTAVALPELADSLDAIPVAGGYLNAILDNLAVVIAGIVVVNFMLVVGSQIFASEAN